MTSDLFSRLKTALAGRYDILREVGSGGMATVYLAEDVKHHRKVALKVLRPELAATLGPDRFSQEIEIAAQLQHPHILPLLDSGEAGGFLYYVMPYVDGESLRDRLARRGELPITEAIRILSEVADALAAAHARGVVHRDIKPDNVMLSGRHALVTDFGVAKAVSEATGRQKLTTAGVALGTPAYMAPEQAAADPHIDHRADIYALGAMGYELITGQPPFSGLTPQMVLAAHVTQAPEPVTSRRPACPPVLAQAIMKCLAKRPADRWQSAEELVAQLDPLSTPSGGMTPTDTAPFAATAPDRWYGHPLRVGGVFVLAAVAVLGAVYFLTIQLGLPDWVPWGALGLLAAGLPIMIVTGLVERRRAHARATGSNITVSGETGLRGWITWKKAFSGGILAFSVLGVGVLAYSAMRLLGIGPVGTLVASGKLTARDKLIVADFENRSSDSTLGPSVTEAFRIDLAQSPVVTVMTSSAVSEALERAERDPSAPLDAAVAREMAVREGAKAIVVGEISPVGKGFVLSAKLVAPDGAELLAIRETADNDGVILPAIDRLSKRVRERIGESLRTIRANEPLEQVTTGSLEALRLYSQGVRASDRGDLDEAIKVLQQAIDLDTGFAMAYRKLAVALGNSGSANSRVIDATTKAYRHRDRLPEIERYQTTAYYFYNVEYDPEKIIAAYRAILTINPNETTALNNLSLLLSNLRKWPEAEQLALHATEVDQATSFYWNVLRAQLALGKRAEARATVERFAKTFPDSPEPWVARAQLASSAGAYDSARSYIQTTLRMNPALNWQAALTGQAAAVSLTQGKLSEAEQSGASQLLIAERRGLPGDYLGAATNLGLVQVLYRNDPAAGIKTVENALKQHPLASLAPVDRPYSDLASFYAKAGKPEQAQHLMAEYESVVPEPQRRGDLGRYQAAGDIAMAEGKPQVALAAYRAWHDSIGCTNCALYELGRAYELTNSPDSALAAYEQAVSNPGGLGRVFTDAWTLARTYQRLGEVYEERGQKDKAIEYYSRLVDLWQDADADLKPTVKEVKVRMANLAGERP